MTYMYDQMNDNDKEGIINRREGEQEGMEIDNKIDYEKKKENDCLLEGED